MGRHHRLCPLLLAACAVAASAQPPELSHPAADPWAIARGPAKVSDAQLSLEVQVRLSQQLDISNLNALARFGVVTLDGKVLPKPIANAPNSLRGRFTASRTSSTSSPLRSRSSWHSPTKPALSRIARAPL